MIDARKSIFSLSLVLLLATCATAQNWPQWRGENLDSVSKATHLPTTFGADENLLWKADLPGPGGASPIVWGDRVFVTTVVESSNELQLICFDAEGNEAWRKMLQGENQNVRMDTANSASPSPSTDGQHVWVTTGVGFLQCFDMEGNQVWSVDLQERYGKFNIQFGMASTPILHDGRLYLQLIHGSMRDRTSSVGHVIAVDASNGEEIWHQERKTDGTVENKHSYASPVLVHTDSGSQLVTHGADYVIGHSLEDGAELWRCGGMNPKGDGYNPYLRFVASPTFSDGKLLVPTAKRGPVLCLKTGLSGDVTEDEAARFWTLQRGTPDVACPVVHDGLVYLAREDGALMILNFDTGEVVANERRFADRHRSTPVVADNRIFVTGRKGKVYVIEPGVEGKVLAENDLGGQITASPAIVDGRIYIRTWDSLYCFGSK